ANHHRRGATRHTITADPVTRHNHKAAVAVTGLKRRAIRHIIAGDLAVAQLQAAVNQLDVPAVVVDTGVAHRQITAFARQHRAARATTTNLRVIHTDIAAGPSEQPFPARALAADEAHRPVGLADRIERALDKERDSRR